jgi:hypothetical protein
VLTEDELRRAAFRDRPDLDVRAAATGPARHRWLAAVVLGAQGWYAAAASLLDPLRRHPDPVLAALAGTALASHRRQLGGHTAAHALDAAALARLVSAGLTPPRIPTGPDPAPAAATGPGRAAVPADPVAGTGAGQQPTRVGDAGTGVAGGPDGRARNVGDAGTADPTRPDPALGDPDGRAPNVGDRAVTDPDMGGPNVDGPNVDGPLVGDPDGVDGVGALVDALLGLAADALGLGRLAAAARLLAAAQATVDTRPVSWRTRVRLGWVTAELALAGGRAADAVAPAERAVQLARAAGAVRHRWKSELVLAAAWGVAGGPNGRQRAAELVGCVASHIGDSGVISLSWPAALLLAEHPGESGPGVAETHLRRAADALSCALRRADPLGRWLAVGSPWVPVGLLRSGEPPNADPRKNFLTD